MTEMFERDVKALVKGYMNDTLEVQSPCACGAGNILASVCGASIVRGEDRLEWIGSRYNGDEWYAAILNHRYGFADYEIDYIIKGHDMIRESGYTIEEINRIERAFEGSASFALTPEEGMFSGLMTVVAVLAEIHGVDIEVAKKAKQLFVKA